MWAFSIVGSLGKVIEQFLTSFGYALSVLNYRQKYGHWKAVSWSAATVVKTAIATPVAGGSVELTDILFTASKVSGGTVVITLEDGTNTETLITVILTNEALRLAHSISGRMQGWEDAILYYTVAGANSTGAITIGYVKHAPAATKDYSVWNSER